MTNKRVGVAGSSLTVGVVGNSHSALVVAENAAAAGARVRIYVRRPLRYAEWHADPTHPNGGYYVGAHFSSLKVRRCRLNTSG